MGIINWLAAPPSDLAAAGSSSTRRLYDDEPMTPRSSKQQLRDGRQHDSGKNDACTWQPGTITRCWWCATTCGLLSDCCRPTQLILTVSVVFSLLLLSVDRLPSSLFFTVVSLVVMSVTSDRPRRCWQLLPHVLLVTAALLTHHHRPVSASSGHCEPVRIPLCRDMPYNRTRMPNLLHHSTQENAVLAVEQYELLAKTRCSAMLVFYLCSVYAPICTGMEFQTEAVPPCRSVCQRVRHDCEPLLNKYNVSWPAAFDCASLPQYDKGVCITPEAIIPDGSDSRGSSARLPGSRIQTGESFCRCSPSPQLTGRLYNSRRFDYAIKARLKTIEVLGELTIAQVMVQRVFKQGQVAIQAHAVQVLWTISACACPRLTTSGQYLILGFEDVAHNRLMYIEGTVATPWKKAYVKKLERWEANFEKRQQRKQAAASQVGRGGGQHPKRKDDRRATTTSASPAANKGRHGPRRRLD